jgi:predicted ATPase/DNA-binding winged helix-turn-helix (wHTH) protein
VTSDHSLTFGPFELLPQQKQLLIHGKPVELGSRALDLLIMLVERAGELVTKDELIAGVWPNLFVEEGNIRVQVAAIRKVLGDDKAGTRYIANAPGRGYRFVAPVVASSPAMEARPSASPLPARALPTSLTRVFGRDAVIASLLETLQDAHLLTIVGAGGIGKSTVAMGLAQAYVAAGRGSVRFVDLAPVTDPLLVPGAIAGALGLPLGSEAAIPGLVERLRDRKLLLVLDGCEHLIGAIASLVEPLLAGAAGLRVLATSQEPLQTAAEQILRLPPLDVPPGTASLSVEQALRYPAIQLFVERVSAKLGSYALTEADVPAVAEICCRLDGIALAIELAAGRVDTFGIHGVAQMLDDRFRLLVVGRRTALPRQQTLRATLAWSFDLLSEADRSVMCRLAILTGPFGLDAAGAIITSTEMTRWKVIECIGNLVAKSLVNADIRNGPVQYRLLDSTRLFALQQLKQRGEYLPLARRHAEHYRDRMVQAESEWEESSPAAWLERYGRDLDNVRSAHNWAFSPEGDVATGLALTAAAAVLWFQLSLVEECRARFEVALAHLDDGPGKDPQRDMRVLTALGAALLYTIGPGPEIDRTWQRALIIAECLGDVGYRLRALWGLWVSGLAAGRFLQCLERAGTFVALAVGQQDPTNIRNGARITAISQVYLGQIKEARQGLDRLLEEDAAEVSHVVRIPFNQRLTARSYHSQILWLQGFPDQALRAAERNVRDAESGGHAASLALTLAESGCPVTLFAGALDALERNTGLLFRNSAKHAYGPWTAWATCFQGALESRRGDPLRGIDSLRRGLDLLRQTHWEIRHAQFLGELAAALGSAGFTAEAVAAIEGALDRAQRQEEHWCLPELLRVKAEVLPAADHVLAERCWRHSIEVSLQHGSLSWMLRSTISLCRHLRAKGRAAEARLLLAEAYGRFTEGFETRDLRQAAQLLRDIDHAG